MGKFDGVLLASDFDNTMVYTAGAMRDGQEQPLLSQGNREALEYFMAQGGIFSVATGRAMPAFVRLAKTLPMNGPAILGNGTGIYDFKAGRFLHTAFLPDTVEIHIREIQREFPDVAIEIYHDDERVEALNPNGITWEHQHLTQADVVTIQDIMEAPRPISKILLEERKTYLTNVEAYIRSQPWGQEYEVVLSADCLMELTVKGADKGSMVLHLADILGIARDMACGIRIAVNHGRISQIKVTPATCEPPGKISTRVQHIQITQ